MNDAFGDDPWDEDTKTVPQGSTAGKVVSDEVKKVGGSPKSDIEQIVPEDTKFLQEADVGNVSGDEI